MHKRWTAIIVLLCMLAGMLGLGSTALADSKTVYVASNTLKVYQKASSSSKTLGTMAYGEKMTCTAVDGSWAQVKNGDGDVGYCKKSGLTTDNPNTLDEKVYLSKTGVKVYEKPSTSADVLMKVTESNLNDSYTAVAITEDGDWYRLKNGKHYGYVRDKYVVSAKEKETADQEAEKEDEQEINAPAYIAKATLKVYKKASTSSSALGTMSYGEKLTLVAVDGSWAKVKNDNGDVGYCKTSGLTDEDPNTLNEQVYAAKDGVKVYQRPDDDSTVLEKLSEGDEMTLVARVSSSWGRVKLAGDYGYVQSKYITDEAPEIEEDTPVEIPEDFEDEPADDPEEDETFEDEPEDSEDEPEDSEDSEDEPDDDDGSEDEGSEDETEDSEDEPAEEPEDTGDSGDTSDKEDPENPEDEPAEKPENPDASEGEPADGPEEDAPAEQPDDKPADEPAGEPEQPAEPSLVEQIVELAKQQLGDPYVYAAHGPDRFDCSGLIYYCYLEVAGIKLARTAYTQGYDESYPKISDPADLKKGDLVFFNTNSKDSDLSDHSGIYIGGGKVIHASSSAAKVITSDLSSGYYAETFSWGRRVL